MTETRVLILGVLLDGPLHGYEVRKRLESWGTQYWANVAYGSIYHALAKMAGEGLLEAEDTGGKTVYGLTEDGRREFDRLLVSYWEEVKPIIDPFQVALTFMDRLSKGDLLSLIRTRADYLRLGIDGAERVIQAKHRNGAPRHIDECIRLTSEQFRAQLAWLEAAVERVEKDQLP
ncbi:helix-turn-helix transcriptional regulator [Streptosporangiaceae bacterium NEAU-GS5]|nr:helix-turn-helix transcriptional regulator [Streptosporangiaceae bacterium NEAU-GS5]